MKRSRFFWLLFFLLSAGGIRSQEVTDTLRVENFTEGISLIRSWKYKTTDDKRFALPDYDDESWRYVLEDTIETDSSLESHRGIVWLRGKFYVDSLLEGLPVGMQIRFNGACEIFANGRLIYTIGKVGAARETHRSGFSLRPYVVSLPLDRSGWQVIAIRASSYGGPGKYDNIKLQPGLSLADFDITILSMQAALEDLFEVSHLVIPAFFCGVFIVLSIFHLVLFLFYRKNKSNLYYSLFTFFLFSIFFGVYRVLSGTDLETTKQIIIFVFASTFLAPLFFIGILHDVFYGRLLKIFWVLAVLLAGGFTAFLVYGKSGPATICFLFFGIVAFIESLRVIIKAVFKKRPGSRIFIFGLLFPVLDVLGLQIITSVLVKTGLSEMAERITSHLGEFFGYSMLMSVSISMTIYLARDFARMNRKLHEQLKEIRQLFDRTVKQEAERKKILENQKEELEKMVSLRTEQVMSQKAELEAKNKDILDNLYYAKRIQDAILPDEKLISENTREHFIIYMPKDIVSGDFYSFWKSNGRFITAVADCTGHGVTGAFMSMIGISVLSQVINQNKITEPAAILHELNRGIAGALKQSGAEVTDGMDIAVISISGTTLEYAGANRPLWIMSGGKLNEIKPDKAAIGGFRIREIAVFRNHLVPLSEGDTVYLFTDGFADQFGGPEGKKILSKRLKVFLTEIHTLPLQQQKEKLLEFFTSWKGTQTQVDDVLILAIRV